MYTDKIHYKLDDALNIKVWLRGESLEEDEQVSVSFRRINNQYYPILGFANLSDDIDFDSLNEINTFVQTYKTKLESLHLL